MQSDARQLDPRADDPDDADAISEVKSSQFCACRSRKGRMKHTQA
jgi:hypothetical protein